MLSLAMSKIWLGPLPCYCRVYIQFLAQQNIIFGNLIHLCLCVTLKTILRQDFDLKPLSNLLRQRL